jgi:hypothetical protein
LVQPNFAKTRGLILLRGLVLPMYSGAFDLSRLLPLSSQLRLQDYKCLVHF